MSHFRMFFAVLALLAAVHAPVVSAQTDEIVVTSDPPAFLEGVTTDEQFNALTDEQKEEALAFFDATAVNDVPEFPPNTVDCFDHFTFGSVLIHLSPAIQHTVSGVPLTFVGTLVNENEYPVVDGAVYVKIFRIPDDGTLPDNGFDIVDQFVVEDQISLAANEEKPFSFVWDVPAYLPTGDYQAAFYYTSAHKFNVQGLTFTDDVVGNVANFSIAGVVETGVTFKKDEVLLNGEPFDFVAFAPVFKPGEPVELSALLTNTTDQDVDMPVTWKLYRWDSQDESLLLREESETVSVPAHDSMRATTSVTDTTSSVHFVVAETHYRDTASFLNVRFLRDDSYNLRLNFPAVTSYPLKANEENIVFSCLHSAGTFDSVENGKLVITLTDQNGLPIHSKTYEGPVIGPMMAVTDSFTPSQTYTSFTLTAQLYDNGTLVDGAVMHYDCASLGEACQTATVVSENSGNGYTVGIVLFILITGGVTLWIWRRKKRIQHEDISTADSDNSDTTTGNPTLISFLIAVCIGTSLLISGGQMVEAASKPWNSGNTGTLTGWDSGRGTSCFLGTCHYAIFQMYDFRGKVVYQAHLQDANTGVDIADNDAILSVGDKVRVVWDQSPSDIIWWGNPGWYRYAVVTPNGNWSDDGSAPSNLCGNNNYRLSIGTNYLNQYDYGTLTVETPDMRVNGGSGLSCEDDVCTVTSAGSNKTITATFSNTTGRFWHARAYKSGACSVSTYNVRRRVLVSKKFDPDLWTTIYTYRSESALPNIPQQQITFTLNAVQPNNPPTKPTIYPDPSNNHQDSADQYFTFKDSVDPDGDNFRFEIDWNNNDFVNGYAPTDGSYTVPPTGGEKTVDKAWPAGTYTFKVRAADDQAGFSEWSDPYTITICETNETWNDVKSECIPNPPVVTLTPDETDIGAGDSVDLTWTVTGPADTCEASGDWSGSDKSTTGDNETIYDLPVGTYTYTLVCSNDGGDSTPAQATVTVHPPTGDLTSPSCTIAEGDTSCGTTIHWSTDYVTGGTLTEGGSTIKTGINTSDGDGSRSITLTRTEVMYKLYASTDHTADPLYILPLKAKCEGDLGVDTNGICREVPPVPTLKLTPTPDLVRSGQPSDVDIDIDATYDLDCELLNANATPDNVHYDFAIDKVTPETVTTRALTATQIVTLSCPVPGFPSEPATTKSARIEVVPIFEEI